jgi:SDR family mycofactocin-dependent oxidoreductase
MGKLDGQVAVITGGARGQGRCHAHTLAREGADIVVCDIAEQLPTVQVPMATEEDLQETVRLVEDLDRRCVAIKADVGDEAQMQGVADRALSEFGRIDILLANAGIATLGPAWELTREQWDEMLRVNLTGVWESCKAVIPHMIERREGRIVATSSMAGLKGIANAAHYVSAKHGVIGLVRTLAIELAPYNIRVNAVCPTNVQTPMLENETIFRLFDPEGGRRDVALAAMRQFNLLDTPWVQSQDISNAVLFLVSDDSRWITGHALPVDAGWNTK